MQKTPSTTNGSIMACAVTTGAPRLWRLVVVVGEAAAARGALPGARRRQAAAAMALLPHPLVRQLPPHLRRRRSTRAVHF